MTKYLKLLKNSDNNPIHNVLISYPFHPVLCAAFVNKFLGNYCQILFSYMKTTLTPKYPQIISVLKKRIFRHG